MTKRKTESDFSSYAATASSDDNSMPPSRKRSKIVETAPSPRLPRRNSTINTTFNLCNDNTVVASFQPVTPHTRATETTIEMDSRELPEDSMEDTDEMRDLTETMRDVVSERGSIKTC